LSRISSAVGALLMAVAALPLTAMAAPAVMAVTPDYQPDAKIKLSTDATFVGGNIYNAMGTDEYRSIVMAVGETQTFVIKIQNDGNVADVFKLKGNRSNPNFKLRWFKGASGNTDITTAIVNGTYKTGSLATGSAATIRLTVTVKADAQPTKSILGTLTAVSKNSSTRSDDTDSVLPIITVQWMT
jgi:uncharacterized membrane protein